MMPSLKPKASLAFKPLDTAAAITLLVYSATVTVTPVCLVILSKELGFGLTAGGGLEAARSALIMVTILSSAFIAARWGKAPSLGVSLIVLGAGMVVYAMAPSYGVVLIGLGLAGLGGGVVEALITPLVQELHPQDSGRYLNAIHAFWPIGVLLTVLLTGDLLTRGVSWRWIVGMLGFGCLLSGLLFLFLRKNDRPASRQRLKDVIAHKWAILLSPLAWLFFLKMFLAGAIEGGYTFWSASFLQIEFGAAPRAGGIAMACFALGMIVGRLYVAAKIKQEQLSRFILLSSGVGIVVALVVPWTGGTGQAYAMFFAAGLTVACLWPSLTSYAAERLPLDPTSLIILLSCAGILGYASASWLLGWLGEHYGMRVSLLALSVGFGLLFVILVIERKIGRASRVTDATSADETSP